MDAYSLSADLPAYKQGAHWAIWKIDLTQPIIIIIIIIITTTTTTTTTQYRWTY